MVRFAETSPSRVAPVPRLLQQSPPLAETSCPRSLVASAESSCCRKQLLSFLVVTARSVFRHNQILTFSGFFKSSLGFVEGESSSLFLGAGHCGGEPPETSFSRLSAYWLRVFFEGHLAPRTAPLLSRAPRIARLPDAASAEQPGCAEEAWYWYF